MPQRRVGHEPDPQLAQQRDQLGLGVTGPQGVLGLQRGDRVHRVGATDRLGSGLREPDVQDLALGDQLGEGADRVLDRGVRVDAVLVVQVNAVGPEPLQRALDGGPDVRRGRVEYAGALAGVRDEAELRRDRDLVAMPLQGAADEFLVGVWAVDLCGVEVGDSELERSLDRAARFAFAAVGVEVVAGHRHRPEADARDVESAE